MNLDVLHRDGLGTGKCGRASVCTYAAIRRLITVMIDSANKRITLIVVIAPLS